MLRFKRNILGTKAEFGTCVLWDVCECEKGFVKKSLREKRELSFTSEKLRTMPEAADSPRSTCVCVYSAAEQDASLSVGLKEVLPSCRSRGLVPVLEVALL